MIVMNHMAIVTWGIILPQEENTQDIVSRCDSDSSFGDARMVRRVNAMSVYPLKN